MILSASSSLQRCFESAYIVGSRASCARCIQLDVGKQDAKRAGERFALFPKPFGR
jgi:hypothetical protein